MPEEINRMVTDSITDWFFTTSEVANANLRRSGVDEEHIFFVGNTMIDALLVNEDTVGGFAQLLSAISERTRGLPVVFPVHPCTTKTLLTMVPLLGNLLLVDPQPYLEFNYLVKHAKAVITDSGGITEETTVMGVPCLMLRNSTGRPETVTIGTNELIGTDPTMLKPALDQFFAGKGAIPEKWDGQASLHIVTTLEAVT
jgi:UDP-N-acetylglucosamine 2-epimerase (non-hydrolysing)